MIRYRIAYPNELYHQGIKGQKWGVRRFQSSDGKLTEEGKKRYSHSRESSKRADTVYDTASKIEPRITKDVKYALKGTTARMYGLNNRLKTRNSLKRKIENDAYNEQISLADSASKIKDAVRYTALSDDSDFTKNYFKIKSNLESMGYSESRCKNFFDLYDKGLVKHKSVQSVFKTPEGQTFEMQFHTKSSQNAKNKKLPLYEEARKPGISKVRLTELEQKMDELAKNVPTPKDVYSIKSHG